MKFTNNPLNKNFLVLPYFRSFSTSTILNTKRKRDDSIDDEEINISKKPTLEAQDNPESSKQILSEGTNLDNTEEESASSSDSEETIRPSFSQSGMRLPNTSWYSDSDDEEEYDAADEQESDDSDDEGRNKEELEAQLKEYSESMNKNKESLEILHANIQESHEVYQETKDLNEKQESEYLEKNGNPIKNKYPDKYDDNKSISENAQIMQKSCESEFNYLCNQDAKDTAEYEVIKNMLDQTVQQEQLGNKLSETTIKEAPYKNTGESDNNSSDKKEKNNSEESGKDSGGGSISGGEGGGEGTYSPPPHHPLIEIVLILKSISFFILVILFLF